MKKNRPQTEFTTLEHMSFTISQISQDILGNQVVERTYWSTRKKVNKSDKNLHDLTSKGSQMTKEKPPSSRKKGTEASKKI